MKEYNWTLDKAFEEVKRRRSVIRPNPGFMQQLVTYRGILDARCVLHPHLSSQNCSIALEGWYLYKIWQRTRQKYFTQYVDSKQRHNNLWRSKSTSNLESMLANRDQQEVQSEAFVDAELFDTMRNTPASDSSRPRSWSPEDSTTRLLLKTQDFGRSSEFTTFSIAWTTMSFR